MRGKKDFLYMTDWGLEKDFLHSSRKNMWNNDYFEFLAKCVWKIDKPVRIIDFGCGYGFLAQMLLPLIPGGSIYKGIDISEELIKDANILFANCQEVSFELADLNEYVPTEEYDIAICQSVLRHLPNPENILKKMVDSVKENGLVICIEPSRRLENAGIYVDSNAFDPFEHDDFLRQKWTSENKSGGRDYQIGVKIPNHMSKLGLKDVGVRINDYVDYIGTINDKEESAPKEVTRFLKDHNIDDKYPGADGFLAARCHVISYGYK